MTTYFNAEYAFHLTKQGFVSTEQARYYLGGVCVEKAQNKPGCYLIATDGHRLGVFYDEHAYTDESGIIVSLNKTGLAACKLPRDEYNGRFVFVGSDKGVSIHKADEDDAEQPEEYPAAILCGDVIDGSFPDWRRRIIPSVPSLEHRAAAVTFNAQYLGAFNFKPFNGMGNGTRTTIETSDGLGPATVRKADFPNFFGVIMPMRCEMDARPDWLDDAPAPELSEAAE